MRTVLRESAHSIVVGLFICTVILLAVALISTVLNEFTTHAKLISTATIITFIILSIMLKITITRMNDTVKSEDM